MPKEKLQIDESIQIIGYVYRWSGTNIESDKRTAAENKIYNLRSLINFVCINILVIASLAWGIKCLIDRIDLTEFTQIACGISFGLLSNMKWVAFLIYETSTNELIAALKNLQNEENDRERPDKINEMIKREIRFLTKAVKAYMIGMGISSAYFVGIPAVEVAINYFRHHELKPALPMLVLFPFDPLDIHFWPFVYVHQIWSVTIIVLKNSGIDCLFIICCAYLRIHFIILEHDIEQIIEKNYTNRKFYANDEFKNKFASLVKRHQNILKTAANLKKIYATPYLIDFFATGVLICLNGFNIVKLDDKLVAVIYINYLVLTTLQLYLVCYMADKMTDQSMRVGDAVYNCNWYLAEKSVVKNLLILLQRAQVPCDITAHGFFDINILGFSKIMNASWSYFTLLNALYTESDTAF